jgi:thymidylate synthase (FAD)
MASVEPAVTLVQHAGLPSEVIASAAKLCYAHKTDGLLRQDSAKAEAFVRRLIGMGHMSPVEHVSFTFYIEGVSRAMTHQLVRHRIASYSQRSQRYVRHDDFDYVIPPQLKGKAVRTADGNVPAEQYYCRTMDLIARRYRAINEALGDSGESSNEDARYVLPNACETKILVTMNARSLLHFFEERLCNRAQWEIRQVAERMLTLAREACPAVFAGAGPKCVAAGKCPEGRMTCGRYEEMKQRYASENANRRASGAGDHSGGGTPRPTSTA